jgi:zinc and cadmium transporter
MNNKGSFVLIGDLFHNFVDGVLIASAFLVNINLGLVTALAIIAHEIPQEVSNISILVNSGFSKVKALSFNVIASITTVIGGVLAFFVLDTLRSLIPIILAFAASTMLYVAVSDLIPDLHKKTAIRDSLMQVLLISSGVIIIYIIHSFLH